MSESGRGTGMSRALVVAAGLFGAAGVSAAAARHMPAADPAAAMGHPAGGALLQTAALFLLLHAAALAGLVALDARWPAATAWPGRAFGPIGLAMAAGVLLFCGDLASRALLGTRLFPGAAPAGGAILVASWLAVALAGLFTGRRGG